MKTRNYIFISLAISTLVSCTQKKHQSVSDAIKSESKAHEDDQVAAIEALPADKLIDPAKGIGQIAINEAGSRVIIQLGKPDFSDAAMGKSVAIWYTDHNTKGYAMNIYFSTDMGNDDTPRVKAIRITSPSFKTVNRLYTGVLFADAQKLYRLRQLGTFKVNGSARTLYDDAAAGIAFETDRSLNITGIAVHESGKSVLNAYMAFFGQVSR